MEQLFYRDIKLEDIKIWSSSGVLLANFSRSISVHCSICDFYLLLSGYRGHLLVAVLHLIRDP